MTATAEQQRPPDAVRLHLDPQPATTTVLDGAWWPRSTDAMAALPELVKALGGSRGEITHALLNADDWDLPHPRRLAAGKRAVRLGWYTSQPHGLLTVVTDFGRSRFDLLVVPPDASEASADTAFAAATDAADRRRAPALLAEITNGSPA
jgi:hypothetical protein